MRPAPAWLAELQARFGAVIRTPLDRSTGTLRATPEAYDPEVDARSFERLAVYNRQYWFRLFGVFQQAFPLTARLFGHWHFNAQVDRFLLENPPHAWDVERATDGFAEHLAKASDRPIVVEAARIDAAFRAIFHAPVVTPFRPSEADAARLLDGRLERSPAVALIEEHWPLVELRQSILGDEGEAPLPMPERLPRAQRWAVVAHPRGIGRFVLEPREAELFALLAEHPVGQALARLEASCTDEERAALPEKTRAWLARSVSLGFWTGLRSTEARS